MKTFTIADIRGWSPCYDPNKYLSEDFIGTAADILKNDSIPPQDRLWVVLRTEIIAPKILRLFSVWAARQVQYLMLDPRSAVALDTAEKFALGKTGAQELAASYRDAYAAIKEAGYAAYATDAAACAAYAATDAAACAYDASRKAQVDKLLEMIQVEDDKS